MCNSYCWYHVPRSGIRLVSKTDQRGSIPWRFARSECRAQDCFICGSPRVRVPTLRLTRVPLDGGLSYKELRQSSIL